MSQDTGCFQFPYAPLARGESVAVEESVVSIEIGVQLMRLAQTGLCELIVKSGG